MSCVNLFAIASRLLLGLILNTLPITAFATFSLKGRLDAAPASQQPPSGPVIHISNEPTPPLAPIIKVTPKSYPLGPAHSASNIIKVVKDSAYPISVHRGAWHNNVIRSEPGNAPQKKPPPLGPPLRLTAQQGVLMTHLLKQTKRLRPRVLALALTAYQKARQHGLDKKEILTIVDFSKPSSKKRLWVLDLKHQKLLFEQWVAHGYASGRQNYALRFSNRINSHESSIGLYRTGGSYVGKLGYSMRLYGLEKGFNNNAYVRDIVFHGSNYVTPKFLAYHGRIGHTWGCFGLSPHFIKPIVNTIRHDTLVFAYFPEKSWLTQSHYL